MHIVRGYKKARYKRTRIMRQRVGKVQDSRNKIQDSKYKVLVADRKYLSRMPGVKEEEIGRMSGISSV